MGSNAGKTRRELLLSAGAAGLVALGTSEPGEAAESPDKVYRIGVISASIRGKPQRTNGHTWHFAQPFHPTVNLEVIKKYLDPGSASLFLKHFRNPSENFDVLPFPDTRISHYYAADRSSAEMFAEAFPGVRVAKSLEQMADEVDAVWMGDASGFGEDHFDLVAPGLRKGLPTFCDKPIGGTVPETRKILEFARKHQAPMMSSSLFRHQWGTEQALRMKASGEFGPLLQVVAGMHGGYTREAWPVYGQHPVWMVMTLAGPGVEAVSMVVHGNTCHALITYKDRLPSQVWWRRPDVTEYSLTTVYFDKKTYEYSPAIERNYWLGHHYQIYRLAQTFRQMVKTRKEPIPHQEILEVTAVIQAAARSVKEKSRLVELAEVMG
jgi:predicted dehydrogenase